MNKNVIYLLDCQFDDEWHKRDVAVDKILENKNTLTHDYISSVLQSSWKQDTQEEWSSLTIRRIENYAQSVGADVVKFDNKLLNRMSLPSSFHPYQRAVFLKFQILREFESSMYDRMLFLDLDILILNDQENIFKELSSPGIYMAPDYNPATTLSCKQKLFEFFKIKKDLIPLIDMPREKRNFYNPPQHWFNNQAFYNWGVLVGDKTHVARLNRFIPAPTQWEDFFTKFNLCHNPQDSVYKKYLMEQDCLLYFLDLADLQIQRLPRKWNFEHFSVQPSDEVNFVHMYDKGLIQLFDKPFKMKSFCSLFELYNYKLNE